MRIRQIVFAARELASNSSTLAQLLAVEPPYADPGVAEFGLHNAVYVFGDQFIEIVAPTREGTTAGRLIERRGDSGYMLILQTDDFDRELARLDALNVRRVWNVALPDIRAMHLHPKDIGAAIVSIDQPVPAPSWRWGGPQWHVQAGPAGTQRVTGVTVAASDPQAMAQRWASVLGLSQPQRQAQGWQLALDGAVLNFIQADARGEGIAGFALAVADRAQVLDTARRLKLPLDGDAVELMGVRLAFSGLPGSAAGQNRALSKANVPGGR
ncbi:MAG: VOC family protein [Rubrivivax sp.]